MLRPGDVGGTADIFVSYPGGSPEDSEHVAHLAQTLERFGLRTWVAGRDRAPEERGKPEMLLERVASAAGCIACVGNRPSGRWGRSELDIASRRAEASSEYPLLTILLPGSDPRQASNLPEAFQTQVFDLRNGVVVTAIAPVAAFLWRRLRHERAEDLEAILAARQEVQAFLLYGPPGSGKSALASAAMAELSRFYPGGRTFLSWDPHRGVEGMADLALRSLDLGPIAQRGQAIDAYQERLSLGKYLVIFDDVNVSDVTPLVPKRPSAAIFASRLRPILKKRNLALRLSPAAAGGQAEATPEAGVRPGFTADLPEGVDLLSIEQPVNALCSVIAAKDVKPPLSIALFGEWGAGKTFFIGKMQSRIEALASASSEADDSVYCSSIKQIVFNAWHYADANLWASLAQRVFEGLAGDAAESQRLFQALASSQLQLEEADAEQQAAERRIARAQVDEVAAREQLVEAKVKLSDLATASMDVLDEIDASPLLDELRATLHLKQDDELSVAAARSLRTTHGALAQLWRQSRWVLVLCLGAIVVAIALALFLPTAVPAVIAASAALGLGVRIAGWPLRWVLTARRHARQRTENLLRQESARLESNLERLRREEEEARQRQEEARREVEATEQEIAEIKDGSRLFRFVSEKSRGDGYEPYLGLVALVRRDFERLSHLIDSHTEEGDGSLPQLERIVLYIDDLDRCPADRVVEVLEAVHLLMASELFVVVVAVDPRWLLSSLQRHYARQYSIGDGRAWSPTPQDYLEKIFQIPFTLPAMQHSGFRRLIESLIRVKEGEGRASVPEGFQAGRIPAADSSGALRPQTAVEPEVPDPEPIDLEPENLLVTVEEVQFMSKLGPVIRTPRSAKRLTNLYRLVRASLAADRLSRLLGKDGEPPGYHAVQLMLATAIAAPSLCPSLLDHLASGRSSEPWWPFVENWRPQEGRAEWPPLREAMLKLRGEPFPDLGTFAAWVPDVQRYSYGTLSLAADENAQ